MNRPDLAIVERILQAGADDRVFDAFLLLGPVLIALIVLLGRTTVAAVGYLVCFVSYVLYNGVYATE